MSTRLLDARRALATLADTLLPLLVALLLPLVALFAVTAQRAATTLRPPTLAPLALPETPPPPAPSRRIAVVVTGNGGAEMTDFLLPYEALGLTGAFDLAVVAPTRALVPMASATRRDGGMELVPDYGVDDYDRLVGRAPDVIVIPYLPAFAQGNEDALVPWIRAQAERGALVVSICIGAEVLAATGLLDGERATSYAPLLDRLAAQHPRVRWVHDVRYVETERTISSGAAAAGVDATLVAIRRLLGRAEAERVAARLGYAHARFLDDPSYTAPVVRPWNVGLGALGLRETLGVVLYDGVRETALASLFETWPLAKRYRLTSIAAQRSPLRTRHGLTVVPRDGLDAAPAFDRVLVPGAPSADAVAPVAAWAAARGVELVAAHDGEDFAYDDALRAVARREGTVVTERVARVLNYPTSHLALDGAPLSPREALALAALAALGFGATRARLARRAARRAAVTRDAPRGAAGSVLLVRSTAPPTAAAARAPAPLPAWNKRKRTGIEPAQDSGTAPHRF